MVVFLHLCNVLHRHSEHAEVVCSVSQLFQPEENSLHQVWMLNVNKCLCRVLGKVVSDFTDVV